MAKKPELEPAWLIGLLVAWGRRSRDQNGLGFPSICVMLKDGIRGNRTSYTPTGYGSADVQAVGDAIDKLRLMRKLAIMRYARPWMCGAVDAEMGRVYDTDTWLYHLKLALTELEGALEPVRAKRRREEENA
jgi:hypothetical protein